MKNIVIILAGGMGKRMKSEKPKVLIEFDGIPMLVRLVREVEQLKVEKILIVVGKYKEQIRETLEEYDVMMEKIQFVYQSETLGTGHAVMCCRDKIKEEANVLILYGDTPLLGKKIMSEMLLNKNKMVCMVTERENPYGCGRIIEDKEGNIERIVEEKDCNKLERSIKRVNCGIYKFNSKQLVDNLMNLNNNNKQNEYYLTDMIEIIKRNEGENAFAFNIKKDEQYQVIGVNTKEELENLEMLYIKTHLTR